MSDINIDSIIKEIEACMKVKHDKAEFVNCLEKYKLLAKNNTRNNTKKPIEMILTHRVFTYGNGIKIGQEF